MKLNTRACGVSSALIWGLGLFCFTWWIILFDGPTRERTLIGRVYRGYEISPRGSLIGLAWALCDGFMGGVTFASVYNYMLKHLPKS